MLARTCFAKESISVKEAEINKTEGMININSYNAYKKENIYFIL